MLILIDFMPIYEYECQRCGNLYETIVLDGRKAKTQACPIKNCGGLGKRVMSAPSSSSGAASVGGYFAENPSEDRVLSCSILTIGIAEVD